MTTFAEPLHRRFIGETVSISVVNTALLTRSSFHVSGVVERIWVGNGECFVFLRGNGTAIADIYWSLKTGGIEVSVR